MRQKQLTIETLVRVRERHPRQAVVLANGVFDMLHVGHTRYLEGAKALGGVLVVAVNSDRSSNLLKGPGRPLIPEGERVELVAALACTDYVICFDGDQLMEIIRLLQPDVHAKGTDYTEESVPEGDLVRALGGRVAIVGDPKGHSTTEILRRLSQVTQ